MERILYTRKDGGVSICVPSPSCVRWMSSGGRWDDRERGFIEAQIERSVQDGIPEWVADKFVRAMAFGGCTEAEAFALIRDRDCHDGFAHEIVTDLPDRWFRDAWRRSHNGGPITIDIEEARKIQFHKIKRAVDRENAARERDLYGEPSIVDWGLIKSRIKKAGDEADIKKVWPSGFENLWGTS